MFDRIAHELFLDEQIMSLTVTLINEVGPEAFRAHVSSLLERFVGNLESESSTNLENFVTGQIRSEATFQSLIDAICKRAESQLNKSATEHASRSADDFNGSDGDLLSHETSAYNVADVRSFLADSSAFAYYKTDLRMMAQEPYHGRISKAIGEQADVDGVRLDRGNLLWLSQEMSWTPPSLFTFTYEHDYGFDYINTCKILLEDVTKLTWNFWPMKNRRHRIRRELQRVSWIGPDSTTLYIDIPISRAIALSGVLRTAPSFITDPDPRLLAGASIPGVPGGPHHSLAGRNRILLSSPHVQVQNASSSVVDSSRSRSAQHVMGHAPSTSPFTRTLHVYMLLKTWSSYKLVHIPVDEDQTNRGFFSDLTAAYIRGRGGWYRMILSPWRYSHCEFQKMMSVRNDIYAPIKGDYPADDDAEYEFSPNPMINRPPRGPLPKAHFQDWYNATKESYIWWVSIHTQPLTPLDWNRQDAVAAMPKKKDNVPENPSTMINVYGLFAQETFSGLWVAVIVGIPGIASAIFFFVWLAVHPHDFQNAVVPAGLLFGIVATFAQIAVHFDAYASRRS